MYFARRFQIEHVKYFVKKWQHKGSWSKAPLPEYSQSKEKALEGKYKGHTSKNIRNVAWSTNTAS